MESERAGQQNGVEMMGLETQTGDLHQYASIQIGEDVNNRLADDDDDNDDKNDSSDEQNVEAGSHVVSNNNEFAYNIKTLSDTIKGKLESAPPSDFVAKHCIFRVIETLRGVNESAYTPVVVSIGPFHRGKQNLQPMEKCKHIYMRDMLSRSAEKTGCSLSTILDKCVESIKDIEEEARNCYSEPINLSSDEFVEMMVADGLFIIELIRRRIEEVTYNHDPVLSSRWHIFNLIRDMALLENQLPMLVLDRLFSLPALRKELEDTSLTMLALCLFYSKSMPMADKVFEQYQDYESNHLLDLLAKALHPSSPRSTNVAAKYWDFIPTATELKDAGVQFKKGSTNGSFLDIKFSDGVLEIPRIVVQDSTDSLLRNLIASEQCSDGNINYFTSYACFMDDLINSGSDVGLLRKQGIITNFLGSDDEVSNLFNKLCYEVNSGNSYYSELYDQVNTYYRKRRHVWRATLKREYFHSPWAIISVAAAILLLVLTLTAAVFAPLSFFVHKS